MLPLGMPKMQLTNCARSGNAAGLSYDPDDIVFPTLNPFGDPCPCEQCAHNRELQREIWRKRAMKKKPKGKGGKGC